MDFASYVHQYYDSGYLVYQEGGMAGKVCADDMNKTVPTEEVGRVLAKLGQSMCNMLEYRDLDNIEIQVGLSNTFNATSRIRHTSLSQVDTEDKLDIRYVDMIGPMSDDKSFINVPCNSREVVKIECSGLECGRRPAHVKLEALARREDARSSALHGDWPWHVALLKNGQHVCDGTLISERWLMTTASCFQGQGRARWVARFASVRLNARAPWEQKRRIVGMVKSPVEGNSIVILKMDSPVVFSDFARPACLPSSDEFIHMGATCATLGWSSKGQFKNLNLIEALLKRDKFPCRRATARDLFGTCSPGTLRGRERDIGQHHMHAGEDRIDGMHRKYRGRLSDLSQPSLNVSFQGEEVAGAPLICQAAGEWHLVGVSAWRKGCSAQSQRPRLYDKVSLNSVWAQKTMETIGKKAASSSSSQSERIPKRNDDEEG